MQFWEIVDSTSKKPINIERSSESLVAALKVMPLSEVFEFCCEFDRKMDEAYTWEVWGVAYLINGGCSDDSFMDFRGSLIAMGKEVFDKAISDAESLLDLDKEQLTQMFEEGYIYSAPTAYEELSGEQPQTHVDRKQSPSGEEWDESGQSLQLQFPKVWSVYGWKKPKPGAPPVSIKPWWKVW